MKTWTGKESQGGEGTVSPINFERERDTFSQDLEEDGVIESPRGKP